MKNNDSRLLIAAIVPNDPPSLRELTGRITNVECNIEESHVAALGQETAGLFLVSGSWNAIARLETALQKLAAEENMTITLTRTEARSQEGNHLPYAVEVIAADDPGIVHHLVGFFSHRKITIDGLVSNCYQAVQTGTPMFAAHLSIAIPANVQIAALREEFMEFCDRLNLDAILEPVKT